LKLIHHGLILGATQSGKSNTMILLANTQLSYNRLTVIINTKREKDITKMCKYRPENINQFKMLLNMNVTDGLIEVMPNIRSKKPLDDLEPYFVEMLAYNQDHPDTEQVLFIDEIHQYQSAHSANDCILNLFLMGLGLELIVVGVSQSPQQIYKEIWRNVEVIILHALHQSVLKYLVSGLYLSNIPDSWLLKLTDPECEYPFVRKLDKKGISHVIYAQESKLLGLREIDIKPIW